MIATQCPPQSFFAQNVTRTLSRLLLMFLALVIGLIMAQAQAPVTPHPIDPDARVIDGVTNSTVFGLGQSIRITGTVKGAIAFGGDVIVEGSVDGDVAAIGGSVVQREGAQISGDVIVLGGIYSHDKAPGRDPKSVTIMYAGYEEDLRRVMRDPFSLLQPRFSAAFFGLRVLAILFWFIVSLALTAAMPNTVSRAIARLQLSGLRVALIGLLGWLFILGGLPLCLWVLPSVVSVLMLIMAVLLVIVSALFGRVVICAATGNWLHRRLLPSRAPSESVKLLLGVAFWVVLSSLPYIWPIVVGGLLVASLGLALTARYRLSWKKAENRT